MATKRNRNLFAVPPPLEVNKCGWNTKGDLLSLEEKSSREFVTLAHNTGDGENGLLWDMTNRGDAEKSKSIFFPGWKKKK